MAATSTTTTFAQIHDSIWHVSTTTVRNDPATPRGNGMSTMPTVTCRKLTAVITSMPWMGSNIDAGIFMSYVGLFSYYNYDNWALPTLVRFL